MNLRGTFENAQQYIKYQLNPMPIMLEDLDSINEVLV